jgi:hypothetical protein
VGVTHQPLQGVAAVPCDQMQAQAQGVGRLLLLLQPPLLPHAAPCSAALLPSAAGVCPAPGLVAPTPAAQTCGPALLPTYGCRQQQRQLHVVASCPRR